MRNSGPWRSGGLQDEGPLVHGSEFLNGFCTLPRLLIHIELSIETWATGIPPNRERVDFGESERVQTLNIYLSAKRKAVPAMVQRTISSTMASRSRSPTRVQQLIPPVSAWTFGAVRENVENSEVRTFPVSVDGKEVCLSMGGVVSPFELSSLSEGNARKSLTLRLPKPWEEAIGCMESCLLHELCEQTEHFFQRPLTENEVEALYKPCSQKKDDYPRHLRVKVNTSGFHACRYWDTERKLCEPPVDHANYIWNAKIHVRAVWFGPDGWGLVLDATDLQTQSAPVAECPF